MYERFTDRARKIMQYAHAEAQRLQRNEVGSEHVLLAIVKEGSGVAANVLKALGVQPRQIIGEIEGLFRSNDLTGDLKIGPQVKIALGYAMEEARNLNHEYIGTEHILLGLVRDEEGTAARITRKLGLRLSAVRNEVLAILGEPHKEESLAYSRGPTARKGRLDVASWLLTVVAWDGFLPALVLLLPTLIEVVIPNNRGAIEITAVLLPITAFFLRFLFGKRHIASNHCGIMVQRVQFVVFVVGIIVLALIECVVVLTHIMPKGFIWAHGSDRIVWAVLASTYLISMIIAMYPGRMKSASVSPGSQAHTRSVSTYGYGRFTDRARKVMQLANQEAQRLENEYIGTEHILRGLVKEGGGVVADVLKRLGVQLHAIILEIEKCEQRGDIADLMGRLPETPRAKKVIEYAMRESLDLRDDHVGTEHILLGLLREDEGFAAQVLMNLGLRLERVRAEIQGISGRSDEERSSS